MIVTPYNHDPLWQLIKDFSFIDEDFGQPKKYYLKIKTRLLL